MGTVIKNIRFFDGRKADTVYIENGTFVDHCEGEVIDGKGLVAAPGLVDMHVHLRDPGLTYKEDILSGAEAAKAGGVTTLMCMPNTKPVTDSPEIIKYVYERAAGTGIEILPAGAVTLGQKGEKLTDFDSLKKAGAVALSDDGMPIQNAAVVREALIRAEQTGLPVISHCEDAELVKNYAVNEGRISKLLCIPGRPAVAEELMAVRDMMLAADVGARIHIAHVSTAGTVEYIRRAKAMGVRVTAETCPQYFFATEELVLQKGALARVNPPLRTERDRLAIIEGLRDGTIDAIVTDHAPHSQEEKNAGLEKAPSGMVGLETSLAIALTQLVNREGFTLEKVIGLMSYAPANILGIRRGRIQNGEKADLILFDPDEEWTVEPDKFRSKGRNTPFGGVKLRGRVKMTVAYGKTVYREV